MESVAASPETALGIISAALVIVRAAYEAATRPATPEAGLIYKGLMEQRDVLAALEVTAGLLAVSYRQGRADERAAIEAGARRGRGHLRAVLPGRRAG